MRHLTSKYSVTLKTGLGVVQGHCKWDRSTDHIRLSVSAIVSIALYLVPFLSYLTLNNIVTLKSELQDTQGHSNWYHSKDWVRSVNSPSIITTAVSLTVYEIFSVKNG